jgi:hypothetical protein
LVWHQNAELDPIDLFEVSDLFHLYCDWRALADPAAAPPPEAHLNELLFRRPGLAGYAHIVDVSPDDPLGFRFRLWASRAPLDGETDYTGLVLGNYPIAAYRDVIAAHYQGVKLSAQPQFGVLDYTNRHAHHHYHRLVLPFGNGPTARLLIAVASLKTTQLPAVAIPRLRNTRARIIVPPRRLIIPGSAAATT